MIPTDQFGKKFYNRSPKADTPSMLGKNHLPETIEKIKQSNTGLKRSLKTRQNNREANKRQFEDQAQREIRRQKSLELWTDPEYRRRQSEKKRGKKQSREQIEKRQRTIRERGHYERWSKERTGKPRGQWGAAFNS